MRTEKQGGDILSQILGDPPAPARKMEKQAKKNARIGFVFSKADSLEGRRKLIQEAIDKAHGNKKNKGLVSGCYIRDLTENKVVFEKDGKVFGAPYTYDAGFKSVEVGKPMEVMEQFVAKPGGAPMEGGDEEDKDYEAGMKALEDTD